MTRTAPAVARVRRRVIAVAAVILLVAGAAGCRPSADPDADPLAGRADVVSFTAGTPGTSLDDVKLSPDDKYLAAANGDGSVWLWDLGTRQPPTQLRRVLLTPNRDGPPRMRETTALAFTSEGSILAFTDEGGVRMWDVVAGAPVDPALKITPPGGLGGATQLSPDGTLLVVRPYEAVQLLDATTRELVAEFRPWIKASAFSPDGRLFVAIEERTVNGHATRSLLRWDVTTRKFAGPPITSDVPSSSIDSVVFSPDGKLLATRDLQSIRFWDAVTGEPVGAPIRGVQGEECCQPGDFLLADIAFSPDGRTIAASTHLAEEAGGVVRFWDVATHAPVGPQLTGLMGCCLGRVTYNRTGTMLLVHDGTRARLWTLP
jgi:WD40 repeat protein